MALKGLLYIFVILLALFQLLFTSIPVGNERAKMKQIPIVTLLIIVINIAVFVLTIQPADEQDEKVAASATQLLTFFEQNSPILLFEDVQKRLKCAEMLEDGTVTTLNYRFHIDPPNDQRARSMLGEETSTRLHTEFGTLIERFEDAQRSHVFYRYGVAPNGHWKPHQLLTCMFLHGGFTHIAGNMVLFAALAISLEALWGRAVFLAFYLLVGLGACVPGLIVPFSGPMIGASGAISGVMGAFLVCLHKTKLKVGWISLPMLLFMPLWVGLFGFKRKPFGIVRIPAYIFLPYFFLSELLLWWFFKEMKILAGTAHSVHVGGFFFGVFFAVILEYVNLKTNFFNLDYHETLVAAELRELTGVGQLGIAEQKLRAFLEKHPNDIDAQVAFAQVAQKMARYDQMNDAYARVIRHYLSVGDKHAALLTYDALLSGFPEDKIAPNIQVNDWMAICDYLQKEGMVREAGVEYERLANTAKGSPLALKACVIGGEAALSAKDHDRALRLFQLALTLQPSPSHEPRIRRGIERCEAAAAQT